MRRKKAPLTRSARVAAKPKLSDAQDGLNEILMLIPELARHIGKSDRGRAILHRIAKNLLKVAPVVLELDNVVKNEVLTRFAAIYDRALSLDEAKIVLNESIRELKMIRTKELDAGRAAADLRKAYKLKKNSLR